MKKSNILNDKILLTFVWILFGAGFLILMVFFVKVGFQYSPFGQIDEGSTSMVGTFVDGIASVFFTAATIFLIYLTYQSNREELKKLTEFNQYQQFIATFNFLLETIRDMHHEYSTSDAALPENVYIRYLTKYHDFIYEYSDGLEEKNEDEVYDFVARFLEVDTNKEILRDKEGSVKLLVKGIKEIFRFIHNSKLENEALFIFKIKSGLNNPQLKNCLAYYGLVDKELKDYLDKYSLLEGIDLYFEFPIKSKNTSERGSKRISFLKFYTKNAFGRENFL